MKDKVLNLVKNNKKMLILAISLFVFIFLLINVLLNNISDFDTSIYNLIMSLRSDFMTFIMKAITRFGDAEILILILITIICLIFLRNKKIGGGIAINLASVGFINYVLKKIIQRPRPPLEFRMVEESSFSFPSGHAMASMAFYGLIIYFINKDMKNEKLKKIISISLSILIFLIGISRIYLGVHYASDVIAGFAISIVYLIYILKKGVKNKYLKKKVLTKRK